MKVPRVEELDNWQLNLITYSSQYRTPPRHVKAPTKHVHDSPDHNSLETWGTVCFISACLSLEECLAHNHHPGDLC